MVPLALNAAPTFRPRSASPARSAPCQGPAARRTLSVRAAASSTDAVEKTKPDWAGEDALSKAVNALIGFKPLFAVMKVMAKNTIKSTAVKNGVDWDGIVRRYEEMPEVKNVKEELEDVAMVYPSYYTQEFHGYTEGNLNWLAAYEVVPATQSMSMRVYRGEAGLTIEEAERRLREGVLGAIKGFQAEHGCREFNELLDEGCSVGVSTRWMAQTWPNATVTGLDLSAYFLAVAEHEERSRPDGKRAVHRYIHGNAESTGFPDASFDLVTLTFTLHECPESATRSIMKEARRLLRPGGVVAITDNDPKSPVIQNLPPVLFTLMKSTEPWSDEYYLLDFEAALRDAGFDVTQSVRSDPRHRTVMARAGPAK